MKGSKADCHCFNLRTITSKTISIYDKYLSGVGITAQQYSILRHIHEYAPITVTALSEKINIDRTTMSRNIKILVEKGYVDYNTPKGRAKDLELTLDGNEKLASANIEWEKAQMEFSDILGEEKLNMLNELVEYLWEKI